MTSSHYYKLLKRSFRFIIFFISIFIINQTFAQSTFNKKHDILKSIEWPAYVFSDENRIYIVGYGTNEWPTYNHYGVYFAAFDLDGNFLYSSFFKEDRILYGQYSIQNAFIEGDWVLACMGQDEGKSYLFVFEKNTGNIYKLLELINPIYPNVNYIVTRRMEKINNGMYLIHCTTPEGPESDYSDPMLIHVNTENWMLRHTIFGKKNQYDSLTLSIWDGKNIISTTHTVTGKPYKIDYKNQLHVHLSDTLGSKQKMFSIHPDSSRTFGTDLIKSNDGGIVIANVRQKNFNMQPENPWSQYYQTWVIPNAMKLDSNFNLAWDIPLGKEYQRHGIAEMWRVLSSIEADGYVLLSVRGATIIPETKEDGDTTNYGLIPQQYGVLDKVDEDGQILWTRHYSILNDTVYGHYRQELRDLEYSSDGGYLLYGYSIEDMFPNDYDSLCFATWLMKTDRHGCIVPGCHEEVSVMQLPPEEAHILIWPNPVRDWLYVFQKAEERHIYHIIDMNGRIIRRFEGSMADETLMIDVSGLKPGSYVLTVETASGKSGRKVFLVF